MKMEILTGQQLYHPTDFAELASNKVKDWTKSLMPPTTLPPVALTKSIKNSPYNAQHHHHHHRRGANLHEQQHQYLQQYRFNTSIKKNTTRASNLLLRQTFEQENKLSTPTGVANTLTKTFERNNLIPDDVGGDDAGSIDSCCVGSCYYDDVEPTADNVNKLSMRLLDELRVAKLRHLACTEVSLPCDLCNRIAMEILRLSQREPCGLRGCTIYIEFEDEPNNSRRIASIKFDAETVSTFEIYLTLRQDHRGWTALLPQFIKGLSRTITLSPEFNVTKNTLYTPSPPNSITSYTNSISSKSLHNHQHIQNPKA